MLVMHVQRGFMEHLLPDNNKDIPGAKFKIGQLIRICCFNTPKQYFQDRMGSHHYILGIAMVDTDEDGNKIFEYALDFFDCLVWESEIEAV
jgi:hypothetical protein